MNSWERILYFLREERFGEAEGCLRKWCVLHAGDFYAHRQLAWCFHKNSYDVSPWESMDRFFAEEFRHECSGVAKQYMQAELLTRLGRNDEAEIEYRSVIQQGHDNATTRHALGKLLLDMGLHSGAASEFERALEQDATYLPTLSEISKLLFYQGRFDRLMRLVKGFNTIDKNQKIRPFLDADADLMIVSDLKNILGTLQRTVKLNKEGRPDDALRILWPIFRRYKMNVPITRSLVILLHSLRWLEVGRRRLKEILCDTDAVMSYAEGLILWYEGKVEEVIQAYDVTIAGGLDHPYVNCGRALAHSHSGQVEDAEKDYLQANKKYPWHVHARMGLAGLRYEGEDFEAVIELANVNKEDSCLALTYDISGSADLARLECFALRSLLRTGGGKRALKRVLSDTKPCDDASLRWSRAMVYAKNNRCVEAEAELEESFRLDRKCFLQMREDDQDQIKKLKERRRSGFVANLAFALSPYVKGETGGVDAEMNKLVETRFRKEAALWYYKGWTLSKFETSDQTAIKDLKKAIELDPTLMDAVIVLCGLLRKKLAAQDLLKLASDVPDPKYPLYVALEIATESGDRGLAKQVKDKLLAIDAQDPEALRHLLSEESSTSAEWFSFLDRFTTRAWLEFESRERVAENMLMKGCAKDAKKKYECLIDDGYISLRCALMHAISCLSK